MQTVPLSSKEVNRVLREHVLLESNPAGRSLIVIVALWTRGCSEIDCNPLFCGKRRNSRVLPRPRNVTRASGILWKIFLLIRRLVVEAASEDGSQESSNVTLPRYFCPIVQENLKLHGMV